MIESEVFQKLTHRPDLPILVAQLNQFMDAERKARLQFRQDITPSVKAEFIAGEVIMHSPAKAKHLKATGRLVKLIDTFVAKNQLGQVFTEKALITLTRNDYEPDIVYFARDKAEQFHENQMEFPAPDFVVEVLSSSTEIRDRGIKFTDYAMHSIREYWIVDCDEQTIEQYVLRDGNAVYHLAQKMHGGTLESTVVIGLKVPVAAVFDDAENLRAIELILKSE